jgi:anti-anti-sigma regulatory factor
MAFLTGYRTTLILSFEFGKMKTSETQLSVWSGNSSACIKVSGRANFSASLDFKAAVLCLRERGCHYFILDFTDCLLMDSTFVGVLAGLGRLLESETITDPSARGSIEILNPNARVTDLLDNLGVTSLFRIVQGEPPDRKEMTEIKLPIGPAPGQLEFSKTCLEAHKILSEINPANAAAFRDVTACLEKKVKRQEDNPS